MEYITFSKINGEYGRLANQLFSMAAVIGWAHKVGAKPAIKTNWMYRHFLNLSNELYKDIEPDTIVKEKEFHYDPNLFSQVKADLVDMQGTFQSSKNFEEIKEDIRKWFKPKSADYLGDNAVAIHIRRGDYINNPNYINLPPEYYLSAIVKYFNDPKYKFYICTDDVEYAKIHFKGKQYIIEERTPMQDIAIMAGCENHILANSSFSWWGAFLANSKKCIRPPKIFSGPLAKTHNEKDFWEPEWICHDDYKTDLKDTTFIIPVRYDHMDRRENLKISINFLRKCFDTNIIIGEQHTRKFKDYGDKYVRFPYKEFHRTKMLNRMTSLANTPYIVNWDADVLASPFDLYEMVKMLRNGYDFVYPYNGAFLRVGDGVYARNRKYIDMVKCGDVGVLSGIDFVGKDDKSVGGAIGYNKKSFISAGGENEMFIAYAPEDAERYDRFRRLGYKVGRTKGGLYHLNHHCTSISTIFNPFFQQGKQELKHIKTLSKKQLQDRVKFEKRKVVFLCYADDNYKPQQDKLINRVTTSGMVDKTYQITRSHLTASEFYKKYASILNKKRGGGYWLWKPYFIIATLNTMDDGDILLYMDSGDIISGDYRDFLLQKMQGLDILLTDGCHPNITYTKKLCFEKMDCMEKKYFDQPQMEAGIIVCKKSERTMWIMTEWLEWCAYNGGEILMDQPNPEFHKGFIDHRHDQSILTNLKVKYNLYSSAEIREYVTCNTEYKDLSDVSVTFLIPLFYDGAMRKKNLDTVINYLESTAYSDIIIGEQLQRGKGYFEYLKDKCTYMEFDIPDFHRTKMLNEMAKASGSDIIVVCDADVIIPEQQLEDAIETISINKADVVYPFDEFVKMDKNDSTMMKKDFSFRSGQSSVKSLGGMILFNRLKYLEAGGENELFMSWGLEDIELYHRFKELGYITYTIPGKLYHLWHYQGVNSSKFHPHYQKNVEEYEKSVKMNKEQLLEYIAQWK